MTDHASDPVNGTDPVRHSYRITPSAYTSDAAADPLRLPLRLLRRHVRRGAHDRPGLCQLGPVALRQPEVHDLGRAPRLGGRVRRVEQDVVRLEVAVDDAAVVGRLHPERHLGHQFGRRVGAQPAGRAEPLHEAAAFQALHRHVRVPVGLAAVEHLDDVRVADGGDRLGLGEEPGQLARVGVPAGEHHLEGDDAVQLDVPGLVHHPMPPRPSSPRSSYPGTAALARGERGAARRACSGVCARVSAGGTDSADGRADPATVWSGSGGAGPGRVGFRRS
jgi:hypothetical protein